MGAYFHSPTTLSLWSWGLLMDYSQDHFSFDALGEKRGGEEDEVVDGDIYYCGVLFLTGFPSRRRRNFMKPLVHPPSWECAKLLLRIHSWIHVSSCFQHMMRDFSCILLPSFGSALLHKRASYSLSSMIYIGPNYMIKTAISYVALGKDVSLHVCSFDSYD